MLFTPGLPAPLPFRPTRVGILVGAAMLAAALGGCGGGGGGGGGSQITPGVSSTETGYKNGVVAVSHPLAAKVGQDVLASGGNAVDAAVAMQFALNVVEPQSSGIGGGGFMMVYTVKDGKTTVIDGRERAPAAATPTMFGKLSFEDASTSGISVGIPGTLKLVDTALKTWGTTTLAQAIAPAITLADSGFAVTPSLEADIVNTSDRGFVMTTLQPETASVFRPNGVPLKRGEILRQPNLAKTFRMIAAQGTDALYKGDVAAAIVQAQTRATTSGSAGAALTAGAGGTMTTADLAGYTVTMRQPVTGTYRGYTVQTMPPPSGGGITVLQELAMLEQFPLGDTSKGFGFGAKNTLNVMIDSMHLAFSDRNFYEGDADFSPVPVAGLLNKDYLASRAALVKVDTALKASALVPGNPLPFNATKVAQVAPDPKEGTHTTHMVVIDKEGNIVTWTTTIESLFGSGIMVPGYGFMLNNEMTDFTFPPTAGTAVGDIGPNDVAPGKRPRSSMSPTILLKDGRPFAALGSAGGSKIINAVVQITANMIDHGMGVQAAVDAPRIHAGAGGTTFCETGPFTPNNFTPTPAFSASVIASVNAMREPSVGVPPCSGNESNGANLSAQAAVIDLSTGLKYGGADKRRGGTVGGVQ